MYKITARSTENAFIIVAGKRFARHVYSTYLINGSQTNVMLNNNPHNILITKLVNVDTGHVLIDSPEPSSGIENLDFEIPIFYFDADVDVPTDPLALDIKVEVFEITSSDNGDGTFSYQNSMGQARTGNIVGGSQVFTLEQGDYQTGHNMIECIVEDMFYRSVITGGLQEISPTQVALNPTEEDDIKVAFKYYKVG